MALDKLVDSTQLDSDLTSVANAIRAKSGGSAALSFPNDFISAVEAIETATWTEQTISSSGAVTQAISPYVIYHFTGALTSLTITLNAASSGQLAQYHFDFNCGSTAPTVALPNTVILPDNNNFDANTHYEVDILNNYGVVSAWATS